MKQPLIYDIQKYSIHDGDGIRTTVFFKGCPLHCRWCHNPESQNFYRDFMFSSEKCTGCGACVRGCGQGAIAISRSGEAETDRSKCVKCGVCTEYCLNSARSIAGKTYAIDELVHEIVKDEMFYEQSGGGVTLSGGEVMAQDAEYIEKLVKLLFEKGFSVNIDTCGYAPYERFERILPYTDTFLYDIKAMDSTQHERFTGAGNELILENLKKLSGAGARIYLRLPLIGNVNANEEFISSVIEFLKSGVNVCQINLLPYHSIGKSKYERLGREYDTAELFKVPSDEQLRKFVKLFCQNGFTHVKIGG